MLEETSQDGLEKLGSSTTKSSPQATAERRRGSAGHPSGTKPEIISSSSEAIPFLANYQAGVGHKIITW